MANHYNLKCTGPLAQNNRNAANYAKAAVNRMGAREIDVREEGPAWCCRFEGPESLHEMETLAAECSDLCKQVTASVFMLTNACTVAKESIFEYGKSKGRYSFTKPESLRAFQRVCAEVLGEPPCKT